MNEDKNDSGSDKGWNSKSKSGIQKPLMNDDDDYFKNNQSPKKSNKNDNSQKKKTQFVEPEKKEKLKIVIDDENEEDDITSPKNENVEEKKKKMNRMSKRRFGHVVKFEKYRTSNVIKIISITLAIIIIPLEIFVQNVLQEAEGDLIVSIQNSFGDSKGLRVFLDIPLILVLPETTCFFMFFFYLSTDSLIAFKSAISSCFGIYFITFLKLLYKDGRPFWINPAIIGYECSFDFAGPGYHLYIITFFWAYNIIMYGMKYAERVNIKFVYSMFGALGLMAVWIIIAGLYTGTIYIYQNVIGLLYGLIYLVLCMNFDTEIHRMCEKTGFIVQSSRKYKFYLFFLCIGLFVVSLIYYNCEVDQWTMPQTWVVNASEPESECKTQLLESSNNRLGLDQTFFYTSILFFITGMGFGTSYSLVHVDCLDWVHTRLSIRILRGILGCGISIGAWFLFKLIPANDEPTKYFFQFALPALLLSFFVYGIFPILCLKLKLVKNEQTEFNKFFNSANDSNGQMGRFSGSLDNTRDNSTNENPIKPIIKKQTTKKGQTLFQNLAQQQDDNEEEEEDIELDNSNNKPQFNQRRRLLDSN